MPWCETCGTELGDGVTACPSCTKSPGGSGITGRDGLLWVAKSPVISSRPVVTQIVSVFIISSLVILAFVLFLDLESGLAAAPYIIGIMVFLILLGLVIAAVIQFFSKGGLITEFAVTPEGVGYRAGEGSKAINRGTLAGSVATGSLSGAGGSLINISREMDFMSWDEVHSITVYPKERSLVFVRKARIFPFAFYCTEENFGKVTALVQKYAPHARYREKGG